MGWADEPLFLHLRKARIRWAQPFMIIKLTFSIVDKKLKGPMKC